MAYGDSPFKDVSSVKFTMPLVFGSVVNNKQAES